jgi:hypothetical protein
MRGYRAERDQGCAWEAAIAQPYPLDALSDRLTGLGEPAPVGLLSLSL